MTKKDSNKIKKQWTIKWPVQLKIVVDHELEDAQ